MVNGKKRKTGNEDLTQSLRSVANSLDTPNVIRRNIWPKSKG